MNFSAFALAATLPVVSLVTGVPSQAQVMPLRQQVCFEHQSQAQWFSRANGERYRLLPGGQIVKVWRMGRYGCNFTTAGYLNNDYRWRGFYGPAYDVRFQLKQDLLLEIRNGGPRWGGSVVAYYPTYEYSRQFSQRPIPLDPAYGYNLHVDPRRVSLGSGPVGSVGTISIEY